VCARAPFGCRLNVYCFVIIISIIVVSLTAAAAAEVVVQIS
jgi:hypothetical protein